MQIQVVPEKVYPNPGKKYAVAQQGHNRFLVPQSYSGMLQPGQPINVTYNVQDWARQGEPANPVNVVTHINGQDITGQQGSVRGGDRPAASPQNVPQSDKEEGMFIMGVVGRAMSSGKFGVSDIESLTRMAAKAWRDRHVAPTPPPIPQTPDQMPPAYDGDSSDPDDLIPY